MRLGHLYTHQLAAIGAYVSWYVCTGMLAPLITLFVILLLLLLLLLFQILTLVRMWQ